MDFSWRSYYDFLCTTNPLEVTLPIHEHPMRPLKDGRMGSCCGIKFKVRRDGYHCSECDLFFHKICSNAPEELNHPARSRKYCSNRIAMQTFTGNSKAKCGFCREGMIRDAKHYVCECCHLKLHLECAKYPPPPEAIDFPDNHDHKLKLEKRKCSFICAACGKDGDGYSYQCNECKMKFHVNCKKFPAKVTHPSHSFHPLKLSKGEPPAYSDGKCSLCEKKIFEDIFYHCSMCNFSLDLHCVYYPPPIHAKNPDIHDHVLTLFPRFISFTCTTCGLAGDRSPYVCIPCNFTGHVTCFGYPWVININRHNHRVSRTSLLGVTNAVCGICQKKMDWGCGGYSCKKCPGAVFHTKCATRKDVTDGLELKGEPEEEEDIEPYEVIDENTIRHFLHEKHNLKLDKSGIFKEKRICKACVYPIYHQFFYSCMTCSFMIHESCAKMRTRIRHVAYNKPYVLEKPSGRCHKCEACKVSYNGFTYTSGREREHTLDVRCASISEPFFHQSHPEHPLFYTTPQGVCSACNQQANYVLRCVEDGCGYILDFKCALLPYEVKHQVDDHFLSLTYGEKAKTTGKYWCDICEKETDPKTWFYTCKDHGLTVHIDCVFGDFRALEPGRVVTTERYDGVQSVAVRNNRMSRPFCNHCKARCRLPIILKVVGKGMPHGYYCSFYCFDQKYPTKEKSPITNFWS